MYQEDSFLTLGSWGQVGLVLISLALGLLMLCGVRRVIRRQALVLRLCLALVAFWAFLWLSPQVYYFYYMVLIDGLPWQSVIKAPPGLTDMASLLTFTDEANLSNHSKGLLGWGMIALSFWRKKT